MRMKRFVTAALAATMVLSMTACGSNAGNTDGQDTAADTSAGDTANAVQDSGNTEGTVVITGSTSVEKIVNEMKSEFEALNPGITIQYTGNGSSAVIKDTISAPITLVPLPEN